MVSCTQTKNQALNHSRFQWTVTLPGAQINASMEALESQQYINYKSIYTKEV